MSQIDAVLSSFLMVLGYLAGLTAVERIWGRDAWWMVFGFSVFVLAYLRIAGIVTLP
jgi:hypothetical protein